MLIDQDVYDAAVGDLCAALGIALDEVSEITLRPSDLSVVTTYAVPYSAGGRR
jgi:hypothetical protein